MMNESEQSGTISKAVAVVGGLLTSALLVAGGHGILTWSDVRSLRADVARVESNLNVTDNTIAVVAAEANANSIHRIEHEKQAEKEIRRIDANETRSLRNQFLLERLRENPAARPDPFTGTEGADLRRRVEHLEQERKDHP